VVEEWWKHDGSVIPGDILGACALIAYLSPGFGQKLNVGGSEDRETAQVLPHELEFTLMFF
jgi:hypothetical protein